MRYLFLDIDGVLNSQNWYKSEAYAKARAEFKGADGHEKTAAELRQCHIDPEALELLKTCIAELGLSVVLSSTWRTLKAATEALDQVGLSFIAATPQVEGGRSREIQAWLDENNVTGDFAILDDDDDMEPLRAHWVQTFFC